GGGGGRSSGVSPPLDPVGERDVGLRSPIRLGVIHRAVEIVVEPFLGPVVEVLLREVVAGIGADRDELRGLAVRVGERDLVVAVPVHAVGAAAAGDGDLVAGGGLWGGAP